MFGVPATRAAGPRCDEVTRRIGFNPFAKDSSLASRRYLRHR